MSPTSRPFRALAAIALVALVAAASAWISGRAAAEPSGSISGTVTHVDGDPDVEIPMDADPVCLGLHSEPVHTEKVVTDEQGRLANVLVYVKEGLGGSFPVPDEPAQLSQKGCLYTPHVAAVVKGQKLVIRNDDPTLHNVHGRPSLNEEFNIGQPFQGMETARTFDKVEIGIPIGCDIHPWMSSYLSVMEHPFFAVSGADGGFTIAGLPPGEYLLEAWHEELGTRTVRATVEGGAEAAASFAFGGS
jgi:hypothetical protein